MKKTLTLLAFNLTIASPLLQGHSHTLIVENVYPDQQVYVSQPTTTIVTEAPPAPVVEVITPSPGPNYYCIDGHWAWEGKWVWKRHEWVVKPHATAYWNPGHWRWSHHQHGYVWDAGHWK